MSARPWAGSSEMATSAGKPVQGLDLLSQAIEHLESDASFALRIQTSEPVLVRDVMASLSAVRGDELTNVANQIVRNGARAVRVWHTSPPGRATVCSLQHQQRLHQCSNGWAKPPPFALSGELFHGQVLLASNARLKPPAAERGVRPATRREACAVRMLVSVWY